MTNNDNAIQPPSPVDGLRCARVGSTLALGHWMTLVAVAWFVSGFLYLTLPPSPDQFNHAYMGWRLVEGDIPYRDFFDPNWPGVMGLHALAVAIFGVNLWSWRAFDFLLFMGSAMFLADIARLAAGRLAGQLSLVVLPLIYIGMGYWLAGQHDMSASQFLAGAIWFHVRACERRAPQWQLAAGLFIGAAMLNKPTVGLIVPLLFLQMLWLGAAWRTAAAHLLVTAVGLLTALLAGAGAVLLLGASVQDLVDNVYTFNVATQFMVLPHVETHGLAYLFSFVLRNQLRGNWALFFASLPALIWMLRPANRSAASTALPLLWLCGVASCIIQARGWQYHLAPSILALAAMLPISLAVVADGRLRILGKVWDKRFGIAVLVLVAASLGDRLVRLYGVVPATLAAGKYDQPLNRLPSADDVSLDESLSFVRRLAARPPNECVLVIGTLSSINYLSQRYQGTRFYYFPILYVTRPPLPMADRWVDLWTADLHRAQCHFVLLADSVRHDWLNGTSRAAAALRQHLMAYRATGALGVAGAMVIYERK